MNKSWKDTNTHTCKMSLHHNNNFYRASNETRIGTNGMRGNGNWVFDTNYFDIFGWWHTPIIIYRYDSDNHFWCVRGGHERKKVTLHGSVFVCCILEAVAKR